MPRKTPKNQPTVAAPVKSYKHRAKRAHIPTQEESVRLSPREKQPVKKRYDYDPSLDPQGAGYQIQQSLIAIGSGGISGRGFGQSIQKFKYLPEPIGDSVFSVASEEFGFVGATLLIAGFLLFALTGWRIAIRAPTPFGRLVTVGLVIMIMTGTFINIASMLGLIPLTGTPLLFVSHGGTALLLALVEAGIILNISR